jgi:hypothetical protein
MVCDDCLDAAESEKRKSRMDAIPDGRLRLDMDTDIAAEDSL